MNHKELISKFRSLKKPALICQWSHSYVEERKPSNYRLVFHPWDGKFKVERQEEDSLGDLRWVHSHDHSDLSYRPDWALISMAVEKIDER